MIQVKWVSKLLQGAAQAVGASATDTAVSENWTPTYLDCERLLVAVKASSVTASTGITAMVEQSPDGGTTWADSKSAGVAISGNGWIYIRVNPQTSGDTVPLAPLLRVTVTTGSGDAVTVDDVRVLFRG